LVTVPCDTPLLPLDLVTRLAEAMVRENADIAMAAAPEVGKSGEIQIRAQPVFCLLRTHLQPSLLAFTEAGGRKIDAWTGQHKTVLVPFDLPGDDPRAFYNANTLAELRQLENT
jgi:molybdopterin-guanine dinucleotide biosynthesis protein A